MALLLVLAWNVYVFFMICQHSWQLSSSASIYGLFHFHLLVMKIFMLQGIVTQLAIKHNMEIVLLCHATVKKFQDIICQQTNRPATTSEVSAVRCRSSRHLAANESTDIVILQIFNRQKSPQAHMASFVATTL